MYRSLVKPFRVMRALPILVAINSGVVYAAEPTLATIAKTGKVRIAYRESSVPFSYVSAEGKPIGYTIDLCEKVVASLRTSLKLPKLEVQWLPVAAAERIPTIKGEKADLECGNTTNTPARRADVAFAVPTFIAGIRIMSESAKPIGDMKLLSGRSVVVSHGTTAATLVENASKQPGANIKIVNEKGNAEAMKALEEKRADAWVTDDTILYAHRGATKTPTDWSVSQRRFTVEPLAIMFRKDDPEFAEVVNREVRRLMQSGEINAMYKKWFETPLPGKGFNMDLPINPLLKSFIDNPTSELPVNY
jgi:ABC-type amino acid transport substrate-binding protein